jgi:hypothetical protein
MGIAMGMAVDGDDDDGVGGVIEVVIVGGSCCRGNSVRRCVGGAGVGCCFCLREGCWG